MIRHKAGYSLLELMLALAIIGTISLGVVGYFTRQATVVKIERTAADIKLIFQAALSYHQFYAKVPSSLNQLQIAKFILAGQFAQNPWGKPYEIVYDQTKQYFGVKTEVPNAVYSRVAALLPSVATTSSSSVILSYMTLPKKPQAPSTISQYKTDKQYGNLKDLTVMEVIQDVNPGITEPLTCPPGQKAKIFVVPATLSTGSKAYPITDVAAYVYYNKFTPDTLGVVQFINRQQNIPYMQRVGAGRAIVMLKCDPVEVSALPTAFR